MQVWVRGKTRGAKLRKHQLRKDRGASQKESNRALLLALFLEIHFLKPASEEKRPCSTIWCEKNSCQDLENKHALNIYADAHLHVLLQNLKWSLRPGDSLRDKGRFLHLNLIPLSNYLLLSSTVTYGQKFSPEKMKQLCCRWRLLNYFAPGISLKSKQLRME